MHLSRDFRVLQLDSDLHNCAVHICQPNEAFTDDFVVLIGRFLL